MSAHDPTAQRAPVFEVGDPGRQGAHLVVRLLQRHDLPVPHPDRQTLPPAQVDKVTNLVWAPPSDTETWLWGSRSWRSSFSNSSGLSGGGTENSVSRPSSKARSSKASTGSLAHHFGQLVDSRSLVSLVSLVDHFHYADPAPIVKVGGPLFDVTLHRFADLWVPQLGRSLLGVSYQRLHPVGHKIVQVVLREA